MKKKIHQLSLVAPVCNTSPLSRRLRQEVTRATWMTERVQAGKGELVRLSQNADKTEERLGL